MTVAEFVNIWRYYYTYNTNVAFTYKGVKIIPQNENKYTQPIVSFKLNISISNLTDDDLIIYSEDYDLDDISPYDKKIIDSLKIEYPENCYKYLITIDIQ